MSGTKLFASAGTLQDASVSLETRHVGRIVPVPTISYGKEITRRQTTNLKSVLGSSPSEDV